MTFRFDPEVQVDAVLIRMVGPEGIIPTNDWPIVAPPALLPGGNIAWELETEDSAQFARDYLRLPHPVVAGLTNGHARSLGWIHNADIAIDF